MNTPDADKKVLARFDGYRRSSKIFEIVYLTVLGVVVLWNVAQGIIDYRRIGITAFSTAFIFLVAFVWSIYRSRTSGTQSRDTLFRGITANLPRQSVRIDERGVTFGYQEMESLSPWTKYASIDLGPRLIQFQPVTGPATINIPRSAFSTEDDMTYFVDIATAYVDSSRTGQPPTFPTPTTWPPPPNG
jgi:hypothetical protein